MIGESIKISGEWLFYLDNQLVKREKNMIVQAGLDILAALLINEQPNAIPFHLALGTGVTPASSADTKLQTEVFRKVVSSKTRTAAMVRLRTFLLASEAIGTWIEFGIFMAGTNILNSGTLLNRILLAGGISKTSNTYLTIETRITFAV